MRLKIICFTILASLFAIGAFAQKSTSMKATRLYNDIVKADSLLFSAFNNCDC